VESTGTTPQIVDKKYITLLMGRCCDNAADVVDIFCTQLTGIGVIRRAQRKSTLDINPAKISLQSTE
jgi:hypothetical protein